MGGITVSFYTFVPDNILRGDRLYWDRDGPIGGGGNSDDDPRRGAGGSSGGTPGGGGSGGGDRIFTVPGQAGAASDQDCRRLMNLFFPDGFDPARLGAFWARYPQ